ncbi:unnamed protein product [Cercopithifilaria johnstoni]|uniref:Uncharacterized protein n=1 Tax=Cercopithifilaria johnstoni TaxID=2874296 RepID=A0A8J2PSE5_9BILA|nr:unnamed protein product [Cercopithifilaria johnstoni]
MHSVPPFTLPSAYPLRIAHRTNALAVGYIQQGYRLLKCASHVKATWHVRLETGSAMKYATSFRREIFHPMRVPLCGNLE